MKTDSVNENLRILLVSFIIFLLSLSVSGQDNPLAAIQWKRWESSITTDGLGVGTDGKPYMVIIQFTGPGGKNFSTVAFTDDAKKYIFRAAFPEVGSWRWRSTCSNPADKSLHDVRGRVEVMKYVGDNPLYKGGDLKLSEDRRYLIQSDGTPFLWMGDTGWNSTMSATMEEWKFYVDTRAFQGFSVIQISPRGVGNAKRASTKSAISFTSEGTPDPAFWKDLDDKIAYANDKGIMILLVGIGNAWRDAMAANPSNQKFETYIAGRMAGHMVIFSPSFDQMFSDELDKVATELQKLTQHLVTQHPGTNFRANNTFRNNTSVDFAALQSGHHNGNLAKAYNAARQWTIDLWSGTPTKPIINIESIYDGYGNDDAPNFREKDSRKPGWISWMSGARGYTYGSGDVPPKVPNGNGAVWMFNKDSATFDYWRNAVLWPSASHMTVMSNFFKAIEWWKLTPASELIRNQENADTLQMTLSRTYDFNLIVAYLPDNPRIVINLTEYIGYYNCTWYNPKTGEYLPSGPIPGGAGNQLFTRPEGWEDAVLKISAR